MKTIAKMNWVLEIKRSKNPIPYEYGYSDYDDASKVQSKIESRNHSSLQWTSLNRRNYFKWNQSKFVK